MLDLLKKLSKEELIKIQGMIEALLVTAANSDEKSDEPDMMMTVEEAAMKANCSTSLIYSEIKTGKLDVTRYSERCYRISKNQMNSWLKSKGWVQIA